jgi:3-carboxy-cis,cis-muconate cycloisomerase
MVTDQTSAHDLRVGYIPAGMTLADALSADPRVSARIDRPAIERLTSPKNYLGLAPEMVDHVLASTKR